MRKMRFFARYARKKPQNEAVKRNVRVLLCGDLKRLIYYLLILKNAWIKIQRKTPAILWDVSVFPPYISSIRAYAVYEAHKRGLTDPWLRISRRFFG